MITPSSSATSNFLSASVKSKIALEVSEIDVVAAVRDRSYIVELLVKSLLSFDVALTVKVRSFMKGLLNTSVTFVFTISIVGWGKRTMLRKCWSPLLRWSLWYSMSVISLSLRWREYFRPPTFLRASVRSCLAPSTELTPSLMSSPRSIRSSTTKSLGPMGCSSILSRADPWR